MPKTVMLLFVNFAMSIFANGQSTAVGQGAEANREYAAVFERSREPCSQNLATSPYLQCMSKELDEIEAHLNAFVKDLRGITGSKEELDALNQTDRQWRAYSESICMLPFKRFAGPVNGPMSAECRWTQDRLYMKQLSDLFLLSQFPNRYTGK